MKKTLLALTSLAVLFSGNTFAKYNEGIKMTIKEFEVLKLDNGEEIRFETHTLKPSMKFEKEIYYVNESKQDYKDIIYNYELEPGYFFIKTKPQNGVTISYSSDKENYTENYKEDSRYIKLKIDLLPKETNKVINFRYMHDILAR